MKLNILPVIPRLQIIFSGSIWMYYARAIQSKLGHIAGSFPGICENFVWSFYMFRYTFIYTSFGTYSMQGLKNVIHLIKLTARKTSLEPFSSSVLQPYHLYSNLGPDSFMTLYVIHVWRHLILVVLLLHPSGEHTMSGVLY